MKINLKQLAGVLTQEQVEELLARWYLAEMRSEASNAEELADMAIEHIDNLNIGDAVRQLIAPLSEEYKSK
jgi:hypothetical protein